MSSVTATGSTTGTTSSTGTTATTGTTGTSTTSSSGSSSSSGTSGLSSLITSTGIGSGLDIDSIVSALTSSYGAAQTAQLDAQQQTLNSQVTAYGTLTSSLDTLQQAVQALEVPSQLAGFTATVGDNTVASASTSSDAVAGSYTLQVNSLAAAETLTSSAFAGSTTTVGTGTLSITAGSNSFQVPIDSTDNTLAGIASAINSANGNTGVTASILTTSDGARLVLSGTNTGASNTITVTQSGGDGGLSALAYDPSNGVTGLTQTQAAADASFSINGYPATSPSNVVSGAITGVSINLLKASAANTPTTLTVAPDTDTASTAIGAFVTALNGTISTIQSLTAYDATTGDAGALNGDPTIESLQNQLENVLDQVTQNPQGGISSLADLGITANTDGSYSSDSTTLSNALTSSLSGVENLLSGTSGLATKIDNLVNSYTSPTGILSNINTGLIANLKTVASQQTALATQLSAYSATLTAKYNAMDTAVANLKVMQQYLTAQFNAGSSSSSSSSSSNSSLGSGSLSV